MGGLSLVGGTTDFRSPTGITATGDHDGTVAGQGLVMATSPQISRLGTLLFWKRNRRDRNYHSVWISDAMARR